MRAFRQGLLASLPIALLVAACGGTADTQSAITTNPDANPFTGDGSSTGDDSATTGDDSSVTPGDDSAITPGDDASGGDTGAAVDALPGTSRIKHVVLIVQENHTFDTYFGRWCQAAAYSNPTCTNGASCCEAAPSAEPSGSSPVTLDDSLNGSRDPDHSYDCENAEMNGGLMDHYVTGTTCAASITGPSTSPSPKNFAISDTTVKAYHDWASQYALGDRYFQPLIGQTSANDMYFAVARWQFVDNQYKPACNGKGCIAPTTPTKTFSGVTTIADVVVGAGSSFAFYAEGMQAMWNATLCPSLPSDCTGGVWGLSPCYYDCSDDPFEYYSQWLDKKGTMKDWTSFQQDIASGSLPSFAYVKFAGYHNEHPGYGTKISNGVNMVKTAVDAVLSSPYADDTLVLVTWDEGGGFYDHVTPPATNPADGKPYGTRVPILAIGRFAKKGYVSHVVMEHSSVVKFLEWNFTGTTGQLGARDTNVNNIGSLLDPAEVGVTVPN
jgi:phospholipase C